MGPCPPVEHLRRLLADELTAAGEEALDRVRLRVEPQTWEAFRLTATEGLSGDAAAARLGMRLTAVY